MTWLGRRGGRSPAGTGQQDAQETRRAVLSIGWQIMLASAVLVLGIVVIAIVFILHQARPREQIEADSTAGAHIYVDFGDVLQALILLGIGAVIFAGLVSWIIARRAVKPLGEALRLQRQFVADASHELRTPLAVLDARLQVVQRRQTSTGTVSPESLAELRSDSKALIDIVGDLLLAAGGGDQSASAPIDAGPVVDEATGSLSILARERGVALSVEHGGTVRVTLPSTSLRRCVIALVDNAIMHSPSGGTVVVRLAAVGTKVVLTVADEGPGISGIQPERVFDRFAHSGAEVSSGPAGGSAAGPGPGAGPGAGPSGAGPAAPTRPSFGIGLALVRDIAIRQGGSVRVASTSPDGTTFRLELPAAR